ncbi:hypothetical protein BV898_17711 [Hypsibius exemplaris]|uniref:Uncharacterized protein n=1 Tax=Hypsibius exemplaris TaxID=2072580 RepID=A0A9X6NHR5_HYPEX|nr:hypothetical protein BV898_17711 [Hypsibius exemplaris]
MEPVTGSAPSPMSVDSGSPSPFSVSGCLAPTRPVILGCCPSYPLSAPHTPVDMELSVTGSVLPARPHVRWELRLMLRFLHSAPAPCSGGIMVLRTLAFRSGLRLPSPVDMAPRLPISAIANYP